MADGELAMTWKEKAARTAIALMVPVAVVWGAVELTSRPEVAGRYAGGVLELFGFAALAYGLHETLAQVTDQPSLRKRVQGWLRKLMFWRAPEGRTVSVGAGSVGVSGARARAKVTAGPDASTSRRVEILEREVEAIREWIGDVQQEGREGREELKELIGHLRSELGDVEEELEDLVRRQVVGSLHWEVTGLLWFAAGVVVATWPNVFPGV